MGPFTLEIAWLKSALAHYLLPHLYNPWVTMVFILFFRIVILKFPCVFMLFHTEIPITRKHGNILYNHKLQNRNINHI